MDDNFRRKCYKCGLAPCDASEIKLYRFPNPGPTNILRCEMWAKYCLPDGEWYSLEMHKKLYSEHKMLCSNHFGEKSFTDFSIKKLNRHAFPDVEEQIDNDQSIEAPAPPLVANAGAFIRGLNTQQRSAESTASTSLVTPLSQQSLLKPSSTQPSLLKPSSTKPPLETENTIHTKITEPAKRTEVDTTALPEETSLDIDFHDEPLPEPSPEPEEKPDVYLCHGCLSIDRYCQPVDLADITILTKLLDRTFGPEDEFMACWECRAGLRRARQLQQRALRAAAVLTQCETQNTEITPQSSLHIYATMASIDVTPEEATPTSDNEPMETNEVNFDQNEPNFDENESCFDENEPINEEYLDNELKELLNDEIMTEVENSTEMVMEKKWSNIGQVVSNDLTCKRILVDPARYREHMSVLEADAGAVRRALAGEARLMMLDQGKPHRCYACCVAYKSSTELAIHNEKEHAPQEGGSHQCSMCKDHFTKLELNAHMREHVFLYKCDVCKRNCATEKRLRLHFEAAHKQIYECNHCQVLFGSSVALTRHCLALHYRFECAHCGVQYMARDLLEQHMRTHHQ